MIGSRDLFRVLVGLGLAAIATDPPRAENGPTDSSGPVPMVLEQSAPVTPYLFDGDVRQLTAPVWKPGEPIREIPRRHYPKPGIAPLREPDSSDVLVARQRQTSQGLPAGTDGTFTTPSRSFNGIGFGGVNPPDPTGAAGPNHYIQSANSSVGAIIRIFDKAEPTPTQLASFALDSLGSAQCADGGGDPIVLYDRHADRWMLSEFSDSGPHLCMYISQTADPVTGGWYVYQFTTPSFPDYPKYGSWPTDANAGAGSYVVTANDGGPGIFAMDRGSMLAGLGATFIRVAIAGLPGFLFEAPTPADLDGSVLPPGGAPAIIMRHRDTDVHGPGGIADLLEMWSFDVDWINTANTVLTQLPSIEVAPFDSSLCGLTSFNCFPQPGTSVTLDPLREVIMNRLQYVHHHDGVETLVGSFVVDIDGADTGGVRWFELRGGTPNWTLYQEGTYSIDSDNRWMSSISMDQSRNTALAYNISSSTQFPGIRYTGRFDLDTLGAMTQTESVILDGTASNPSIRYGDYSHMSLDPEDDCTFWFTGEVNTSSLWTTQIGSFRFEDCGCTVTPESPALSGANNGDNRVDLDWDDSDLASVVTYHVLRSRTPGGPYEQIAEIADTSPGVADDLGYTFSDFDVSGGIDYYYVVRAFDGVACNSPFSNEIMVTATGLCTLAPVFGGVGQVDDPEFGICTLDVSWAPANPECGASVTYNVYRSTMSGFVPGAGNVQASGVIGTSFSDLNQVVDGMVYFYKVRAVDVSNGVEDENDAERSGEPSGVGGANCTTGSNCAENPFVDVSPDGPVTACQGSGPTLTAALNGGTGPFTYQWIRDGMPVPGENGPSYTPTSLGLHAYNVRVSAQACPDDVTDGLDAVIALVNEPTFAGLTSVVPADDSICTVDMLWDPASTLCAGPVTYNLYRDTSAPPALTHQNLIAGGLTGTSYTDTFDLVDSQTYFYTAKALDQSTLRTDDNNVVLSATPDGPNNGIQNFYDEGFSDVLVINDWTIDNDLANHSCGEWAVGSDPLWAPSMGSGNYLIADNRCAPLLPRTSTTATSPSIDLVIPGLQSVTLRVKARFDFEPLNGEETGAIEIWDGTQWVALWNSAAVDVNQQMTFDVTAHAAGNSDFKVRFNYANAVVDQYFSIDDVTVITDVISTCATESSGPASVPRGSLAAWSNGSGIDLVWDTATCSSADYSLLYGDLANVATYALQGSVCALGSSGTFGWASPPAGNLYFLVVPTDGAGTEGSWGLTRALAERNGSLASNECGVSAKNPTHICE